MATDGDQEISRARQVLEAHGLKPSPAQTGGQRDTSGKSLGERFVAILRGMGNPVSPEPVELKPEDLPGAEEEQPLSYTTPTGLPIFPSEKKR